MFKVTAVGGCGRFLLQSSRAPSRLSRDTAGPPPRGGPARVWKVRGWGGAGRATPPGPPLAEAALLPAGAAPQHRGSRGSGGRPPLQLRRTRAMQSLAMDLRVLSRELALYLEHQVRVGFFGSGMGLSLILGFSVAYACYYLSSIAKVSRGRGRRSVVGSGAPRARGDTSCLLRSRVLPPGLPASPSPDWPAQLRYFGEDIGAQFASTPPHPPDAIECILGLL